jgi:hypothetical protein
MAENISLNNVATFQNDTSAVGTVNNNNAAITTAFIDVLSRSGVSPNQMTSSLDMNNNQIINLPPPQTVNSPARLIDITTPGSITIVTATTGTSGHTVPFLDGANTWSNSQAITMPAGIASGLQINQTPTGTVGGPLGMNTININGDNINAGANVVTGLLISQLFGGSAATGARTCLLGQTILTSPTNASNPNRNYTGATGQAIAQSPDGGTSPTTFANSAGNLVGGTFQGIATAGATALGIVAGSLSQTSMNTGSSSWAKAGAMINGNAQDLVAGTVINSLIWMNNNASASAKWTNGILIDDKGGQGFWPISSSGTIIKTSGGGTAANGIDFTNTSFSGNTFASTGFSVSSSGNITSGVVGGANSGALFLVGKTSGQSILAVGDTGGTLFISGGVASGGNGAVGGALTLFGQTSGSAVLNVSATGGILQTSAPILTTSTLSSGSVGTQNGVLTLSGVTSGSVALSTPAVSNGLLQFASSGSFSANGSVATVLGSLGPAGSHTAVQKWLTIVDNTGTTLYIPAF